MKTKTKILGVVASAALIGSMVLTSAANSASIPSSPAERAATAALNRDISFQNASENEQYTVLQAQYEEEMKQYELEQRQYRARQATYPNAGPYDAENADD
jgi:hypothetical protein